MNGPSERRQDHVRAASGGVWADDTDDGTCACVHILDAGRARTEDQESSYFQCGGYTHSRIEHSRMLRNSNHSPLFRRIEERFRLSAHPYGQFNLPSSLPGTTGMAGESLR